MSKDTQKVNSWKRKWPRRITQAASIVFLGQWSIYGILRCPFLVPFVSCQTCPVLTCWGRIPSLFWGFWISFFVLAYFFGRAFCGWVCPGGLLNQIIGRISILKLRVRNALVAKLSFGVFLSLIVSIWIWLAMDNPRMMVPIRTGDFLNSVKLSFEHAQPIWLIRSYLLIGFVIAGFVFSNFWCRFVCPTAGILELIRRISRLGVFRTGACNDCDRCLSLCEMGTRPSEPNCTNCTDCLGSCPVNAIRVGRPTNDERR